MKKITASCLIISFSILLNNSCISEKTKIPDDKPNWNNEVIYHVFLRSFYDSNGDLNGDLNGLAEKLDYIQELGATAILVSPIFESGYYHNYFPTDYEKIDAEYGTKQDYLNFVNAVHQKGMKFLLDMETQYAQSGNKWFDDSYKNPQSEYSDYIYYSDSLNLYPEQIFFPSKSPLYKFKGWPGNEYNIVILNLNNQKVKDWAVDFYSYWVDPNGDGKFDDGVDGFRIDHIMDDLDNKGLFTNMYNDFWRPVFQKCKSINPRIFIVGEQANWGDYGEKMVAESDADAAFNFHLCFAMAGVSGVNDMFKPQSANGVRMNSDVICREVSETMRLFGDSTYNLNFLENHDTNRWASVVDGNMGQIRIGAVLNILMPGVPSVYYGQELGVTGKVQEWGYDVNHIPVREAFPWTPNPDDKGTAVFYKDSGPWWDQSFFKTGETEKLALSVQKNDPSSLWNLYCKLIAFRKTNDAVKNGNFIQTIKNNPDLLAFSREKENEKISVMINLSDTVCTVLSPKITHIEFQEKAELQGDSIQFQPFGFVIGREK
jgi:alpha-amylase